MAAYPTLEIAVEQLKEQHGITTTARALEVFKSHHLEEYEKLRNQLAPLREQSFANDMLDVASMATQVEQAAIAKTMELLEAGRIADPSKVARDLADVKAKNTDKRLAIQGRPTSIIAKRSVEDIWDQLEDMGVVTVDAEVVEQPALPAEAQDPA
jgi:predicted transcriptional regulator